MVVDYDLEFENVIWGNALFRYDPVEQKIKICNYLEWSTAVEQLVEREMEAIISHETIHAVLHKLDEEKASFRFDLLGEKIGYMPFSFTS